MQRSLAAGTVVAACLVVAPGTAAAAPSDSEISAAQQAREEAAAQVGAITGQLAGAQAAVDEARIASQIALQDYEERQGAYDDARAAADAAQAAAAQAAADVAVGRGEVAAFARDSYKQGSTDSGARALMAAGGPAELIERAALLAAVGEHRVDVVAALTVLQEQAAVAEQAAQQAVAEAETLKTEAAELLAAAQEQEVAARAQAAALASQQEQLEEELEQAQQTLYGLEGARQAAEARAAAQRAAAPVPTAQAATSSASTSSASASTSASSASASTSASSSGRSSSGGSSSGGSSSSGSSSSGSSSSGGSGSATGSGSSAPAPAPVAAPVQNIVGAPSGSAVQTAIAAAKTQQGLPYSWGGGGSSGPSYGIPPDTEVWGFDCSGLTQYAYAQSGVAIGGTSREQWYRFRDQTVDRTDLQAGDLVFWGSGSDYSSIYHVALYLGGNKVIQAPQSGDVVRISTMWFGSDYFGAVRPTA